MPDILTDWVPIATDARNGSDRYWPWVRQNDDEVAVDLADMLDSGESITNLAVTMLQLKSTTESADTDATSLIVSSSSSGTVVKVRMASLVYQRVYRMTITFGPAGNKRSATAVVWVVA